jgi:polyhydroxybutyrate depolymerase
VWAEDATKEDTGDDVAFLADLIDELVHEHHADRDAIYLAGMGNGGLMTYRAACERPELFKGAIVVSALMWGYHQENCPDQADAPLDFLIIHGSNDYFYTPDTHFFSTIFNSDDPPLILGVEDTLSFWASRNGCDEEPDFESENVTQFAGCDEDTVVAHYNVLGGGHTWARIGDYQLNQVGVDASQLIPTSPHRWSLGCMDVIRTGPAMPA